ncbi:MAG: CHAP domain-containing protein [Bacteroidales bacterium]|jgi:hypothetical protein|nr:CHAP domain-containing protein [Bacteroidales bacterium]
MRKIVDVALGEIRYREDPPNSNKTKYGEWFGLDGVPWCGIFVSWVYDQAGFPLGNIGFLKGFAGCQTAASHFLKTGEVVDVPSPGDIVFFDWDGNGRYDHAGIVTWVESDHILTVEGNTSYKNQSNGGEVMSRVRQRTLKMLFVHPRVLDV